MNDDEKIAIKSLANYLVELRISRGFKSVFEVAKTIKKGQDSVYKLEKGLHLPTRATIMLLLDLYKPNKRELETITALYNEAQRIRKERKKHE